VGEPSYDGLLTVQQTADAIRVSTKTVRRWIASGKLVTHRFSRNLVRVDADSVARLLAGSSNGSGPAVETGTMTEDLTKRNGADQPQLLRQASRSRVWIAWFEFKEVPLGTTDRDEAERRLAKLVADSCHADSGPLLPSPTGKRRNRRPYRVYAERERFVIKYYDDTGRRTKHWIPNDLAVPIATLDDAEVYAAKWYQDSRHRLSCSTPAATSGGATDLIRPSITLEEFGRLWTSGALARRFPDHVKAKASAKDDESRLETYVYPWIGNEEVRGFEGRKGVELVELVVAGLPPVGPTFRAASRRQVLQAVHRLLVLAVYPAKLLAANPLPRGFVPKAPSDRAKSYLYPDEDARLMACEAVPLQERLFYGILAREGMRVSELLNLTWADVDLKRGVLTLDETKTDEPRAWAMDGGVVMALKRWRDRFVPNAPSSAKILADSSRSEIERYGLAERLRAYLQGVGVKRAQIFDASDNRIPLRAHDLRATFVTVNLSLGRTEAWITDRTGHKSSQMIYRYKRAARTHAELTLGELKSLVNAIPELVEPEAVG
jgi:excisionase family DNA binding protein